RGQEASFALCISTALGLGPSAELLGTHFAVGAVYGALSTTPQLCGQVQLNRVRTAVSSPPFAPFAPLFFAYHRLNFAVPSPGCPGSRWPAGAPRRPGSRAERSPGGRRAGS